MRVHYEEKLEPQQDATGMSKLVDADLNVDDCGDGRVAAVAPATVSYRSSYANSSGTEAPSSTNFPSAMRMTTPPAPGPASWIASTSRLGPSLHDSDIFTTKSSFSHAAPELHEKAQPFRCRAGA